MASLVVILCCLTRLDIALKSLCEEFCKISNKQESEVVMCTPRFFKRSELEWIIKQRYLERDGDFLFVH